MVSCSVPNRKHQFIWAESVFVHFWRYSEVAGVVVGRWIFFLHKLDPVWKMGCCFLSDHAQEKTCSVLLEQCLLVASCALSLKAAEKILEETAPGELEEGWKWGNVIFPNLDVLSPSHVSRIKFICHKIRKAFLSWKNTWEKTLALISKQRENANSDQSESQWRCFVWKDMGFFFFFCKHCYTIYNIILLFILISFCPLEQICFQDD